MYLNRHSRPWQSRRDQFVAWPTNPKKQTHSQLYTCDSPKVSAGVYLRFPSIVSGPRNHFVSTFSRPSSSSTRLSIHKKLGFFCSLRAHGSYNYAWPQHTAFDDRNLRRLRRYSMSSYSSFLNMISTLNANLLLRPLIRIALGTQRYR